MTMGFFSELEDLFFLLTFDLANSFQVESEKGLKLKEWQNPVRHDAK